MSSGLPRVTVLGLGRLGAPVARRLAAAGFGVTGWSRSGRIVDGVRTAADSAGAVRAAEIVLLVLFDGAACSEVLAACGTTLPAGATVLNLSTVAPEEAAAFGRRLGDRYVHCPVLGSGPAARAGGLTLLVGAAAVPDAAEAVLSLLGQPLACGDAATAAALKLVANGVLADALVAAGRAAAADFTEISRAHARGPAIVDAAARLSARPGLDRDPALLAPLVAYARGHATGDSHHFRAAFRPTAHVEGLRAGRFVSWDLDAYCGNFGGSPASDEPARRRTVLDLRRHGTIATATMLLEHGADTFVDAFLLVHEDGGWRIANKAYDRRS